MSGQNRDRARRDFVDLLNKDRPLLLEPFYNCLVVNDCAAHIHRSAMPLQRLFDRLNRPFDPRTESTRISQQNSPLTCDRPSVGCNGRAGSHQQYIQDL